MVHILGLESLFFLWGPSTTEKGSEVDRALQDWCRPVMILGAFFTQKPSIMAEPSWRAETKACTYVSETVPIQEPGVESDTYFVMDVLAQLPTLFIHSNQGIEQAFIASSPADSACACTIWANTEQLRQDLEAWKASWDNRTHREIPSSTLFDSSHISASNFVIPFRDMKLAITFSLYLSTRLLLNSVIASLHQAGLVSPSHQGLNTSECPSGSLDQQILSDDRRSIYAICSCVDCFLEQQQSLRTLPDYYLFFPLHVAKRAAVRQDLTADVEYLNIKYESMISKYPMGVWANMDFGDRFNGYGAGLFG